MSNKGIYYQIREQKVSIWGSDKDKIVKAMNQFINNIKTLKRLISSEGFFV